MCAFKRTAAALWAVGSMACGIQQGTGTVPDFGSARLEKDGGSQTAPPSPQVVCVAGSIRVCGSDVGACKPGVQTCAASSEWGACTGGVGPTQEVCNGADDDCNGVPDNGIDSATDVNNCGGCNIRCRFDNAVPACEQSVCKVASCSPYFWNIDSLAWNGCEYGPCMKTVGGVEACDGIDNNCDGATDEGLTCPSP